MPKVKKEQKNGKKSKEEPKVIERTKNEKKVRKKQPVRVKLELDECTFTYRDPEKEAEADRNACGHQVMSVSEYVRSVRPELVRDIKPKIEPVIKQEPDDSDADLSNSRDNVTLNDDLLNDSRREQPNNKSIGRPHCYKKLKNRQCLAEHRFYAHKEKTLKCDICDKFFRNLSKHRLVHFPKKFQCDVCQMKFTYSHTLKKHIGSMHEVDKRQKCTFCKMNFVIYSTLITHIRSKHFNLLRRQDKGTGDLHKLFQGIRTFECYRCKFSSRISEVKKHMQICRGDRKDLLWKIKCDFCIAKFTEKGSFKKHMWKQHSIHMTDEALKKIRVDKLHKCTFCDECFYNRCEKFVHIRSKHFDLLRQQDKGTGDLHALFQGNRTYECYRCKFSNTHRNHVKKHMEKCEGIIYRTVKCQLCNNRFKNKVSLRTHLRKMHSIYEGKWKKEKMLKEAKKTFECIDCKKHFVNWSGLYQHIKKFCKNRVFKCDYCPKKFPQQIDKDDHHRRVHPILLQNSHDKKYECHVCKVCMPVRRAIGHLGNKHQTKTIFKLDICRLKVPSCTF